MEHEELVKSVRQLRKELKLVNDQNKALKQRLCATQKDIDGHVKKLKTTSEDRRCVQKLLHHYAGADVTIKENTIDVSMTPLCFGVPQKQHIIILKTQKESTWEVVGYDLPLSVPKKQGIRVYSLEELGKLIRQVSKEVQAYAERNYQVTETEKILSTVEASIWYTTKLQKVFLNLPLTIPAREGKVVSEVILDYEVDHILPLKVTTNAQGLEAEKLKVLRKRMTNFFAHFSLLSVIREEFDREGSDEISTSRSILSQLSP